MSESNLPQPDTAATASATGRALHALTTLLPALGEGSHQLSISVERTDGTELGADLHVSAEPGAWRVDRSAEEYLRFFVLLTFSLDGTTVRDSSLVAMTADAGTRVRGWDVQDGWLYPNAPAELQLVAAPFAADDASPYTVGDALVLPPVDQGRRVARTPAPVVIVVSGTAARGHAHGGGGQAGRDGGCGVEGRVADLDVRGGGFGSRRDRVDLQGGLADGCGDLDGVGADRRAAGCCRGPRRRGGRVSGADAASPAGVARAAAGASAAIPATPARTGGAIALEELAERVGVGLGAGSTPPPQSEQPSSLGRRHMERRSAPRVCAGPASGVSTRHLACWLVTSPGRARPRRDRQGIAAGRSYRAQLATPPRRHRSPW
ncbi:hypothetical protein SAMN05216489_00007 [Streptomyces sp. 3213]|nr:hypothetical protein SAMN05216489_00007 [Streptomyces sp. 3213] [Streptomyces sp. 3213.3]